jgi:hypothetical protein
MERKQNPHAKSDARPEREKIKLDRRYGEIGISAVKAAVQPHGEQHQQQPRSGSKTVNRRQGR